MVKTILMLKLALVFVGGGPGAAARYLSTLAAARWLGAAFPWGTLFVNLAGCFLIGVIWSLAERTALVSPSARLFLITGILGGLTTFSSYAAETALAFRVSPASAFLNMAANNFVGILLVLAGFKLVQLLS
jgi:CrcB protein